jgi:hypothetical protein
MTEGFAQGVNMTIPTDISSPLSSSSTTMALLAFPNFFSSSICRAASHASARVLATTTPFPAASPDAFTTSASNPALGYKTNRRHRVMYGPKQH